MRLVRLTGLAVALALVLAASAVADDVPLGFTNGFLASCPAGGCATVSITVSGTTATFTVSSLLDGYQFDTFGFNFSGGSLSLVPGSVSGAVGSGAGLSGVGAEDGFGKFLWNFDTGINGGSTGSACSGVASDPDCTFTFQVTGTGVTSTSQFEYLQTSSNPHSNTWFAGHIANDTCTGFVGGGGATSHTGDTTPCGGTTTTPEPSSLTLLGASGLLSGFGLAIRRKLRK
jgi:hypothetical protein